MPAKVTQFPAAARPLNGNETLGFVKDGNNARATMQDYYDDFVAPQITNLQNQINGIIASSVELLPTSTISTAVYTLDDNDIYIAFELTFAGAVTINIPNNTAVPLAVGARVRFCDMFGSAVLVPAPGVTLISRNDEFTSGGPGAIFEIHKASLNTWWLLGDVQE